MFVDKKLANQHTITPKITQSQQRMKVEEESMVTGKVESWRNNKYKGRFQQSVHTTMLAKYENLVGGGHRVLVVKSRGNNMKSSTKEILDLRP